MSGDIFLSILIPTFNRVGELSKNLLLLRQILSENQFRDQIELLISDNHSTDGTKEMLSGFDFWGLSHTLSFQDNNVGPISNCLFLLGKARGTYFMYIGDDDYLDKEYLNNVLPILKSDNKISTVIPSTLSLYSSGEILPGRDFNVKSRIYNPGFKNCLENSWRGTQLSATIHLKKDLFDLYYSCGVNNLYPYVFFIAVNSLRGKSWNMTDNPVTVTQMDEAAMRLDYGSANLIPEIFDNYKKIPGLHYYHRVLLEIKLLDVQPSRYLEYLKLKGLTGLMKCMLTLFNDENTSTVTKLLLPFIMTFGIARRGAKGVIHSISKVL